MGCIELCEGMHTARRQTPIQIPIGFCANLSASVTVMVTSVSLGAGSVNTPFSLYERVGFRHFNESS